jgi:glycosyltransferase involved in cell wall biosynthesis
VPALNKILILSSSNPYKLAGVAAKDLLDSFRNTNGINAKLVTKEWDIYQDPDIISVNSFISYSYKKIIYKLKLVLQWFGILKTTVQNSNLDYYVLDYDETISYYSTERILKKVRFKPDAIIVLFMQGFLSYRNLYELNKITKAPIFLYLMDMAALTGGCHYAWDCKGYLNKCGNCPALFSSDPFDQTYINWVFKNDFVTKTNIKVISGSQGLYQQALYSSIFMSKKKYKVYLSINEQLFKPANKSIIRKQLGLPLDKKMFFFGAVSLIEKRKGMKLLLEALSILNENLEDESKKNIHLIIAGNNAKRIANFLPFSYTLMGVLSKDNLPKAFQAADVFVSPSIEESGPMMINQSMMSGTPVVAFEVGVAIDLVKNGETGYLAKLGNSGDLARGLLNLSTLPETEYFRIVEKCRTLAFSLFNSSASGENFIRIFNNQKLH